MATASSTRGNHTEYYNLHKLDNNSTLKEALGIKKLIPKKWNSSNVIEAELNDGTIEGIEVKMNWKDIMGSGGLFFDGKKVKENILELLKIPSEVPGGTTVDKAMTVMGTGGALLIIGGGSSASAAAKILAY